jgi:hypothetical protein
MSDRQSTTTSMHSQSAPSSPSSHSANRAFSMPFIRRLFATPSLNQKETINADHDEDSSPDSSLSLSPPSSIDSQPVTSIEQHLHSRRHSLSDFASPTPRDRFTHLRRLSTPGFPKSIEGDLSAPSIVNAATKQIPDQGNKKQGNKKQTLESFMRGQPWAV